MTETQAAPRKIVLGDQWPAGGGLLRAKAVRSAFPSADVMYLAQDADTPWISTGLSEPRVINKWTDYWSLGCRIPWTLYAPGHQLPNIAGTFKSPRELAYLSGPPTEATIKACYDDSTIVGPLVQSIHDMECSWAMRVAETCGVTPHVKPSDMPKARSVREMLHSNAGVDRGLIEFFRESPPVLFRDLRTARNGFWRIDEDYKRHPYHGETISKRDVLVPRGMFLLLEYNARGYHVACTMLGYTAQSLELRDRYLPRMKVHVLQVEFDWRVAVNPIRAMIRAYDERKRRRGEQPPDISHAVVDSIARYWNSRPTDVSYAILGGELRPRFTHHEL